MLYLLFSETAFCKGRLACSAKKIYEYLAAILLDIDHVI